MTGEIVKKEKKNIKEIMNILTKTKGISKVLSKATIHILHLLIMKYFSFII